MKYLSTKFEEYINNCEKTNLHTKLEPLYKSLSTNIEDLKRISIIINHYFSN